MFQLMTSCHVQKPAFISGSWLFFFFFFLPIQYAYRTGDKLHVEGQRTRVVTKRKASLEYVFAYGRVTVATSRNAVYMRL